MSPRRKSTSHSAYKLEFLSRTLNESQKPSKSVLVVEDDPSQNLLYSTKLKNAGYEVISALDGERGYKEICERKPDLVLLDLMLPRVGGFQLLRKFRLNAEFSKTPVVMMTAAEDSHCVDVAKNWGIEWFFKKPLSSRELVRTVNKLLP